MEYKGKLYGKVGNSLIPLEATTEDFERYKALYLEGRELLEAIMRIKDLWVPEYPVSEKYIGEAQALYNMAAKIDQFLTNHKYGE